MPKRQQSGRAMDYSYMLYALLFAVLLANEMDLLGGGSDDSAAEGDDAHPLYEPADFSAEIAGSAGNDVLRPEAGADNLAWLLDDGDDRLTGSAGADYADGGAGDDRLFLADGDDIAVGQAGADVISGGAGHDTLLGGDGADWMAAGSGNDALAGEAGNDSLLGGDGADVLNGGDGDDSLSGYGAERSQAAGADAIDGVDTLIGGAGNDTLLLGAGDRGTGGEGEDLFRLDHADPDQEGVAQITDFAQGDRIEVIYTPTLDAQGNPVVPELTVSASEDGTAGILRLGDQVVGAVLGGQSLTAADIDLIPQQE